MNRWILAILASLSILVAAHAQTKPKLDPGAFQPYLWRVAVKLTPHPTLTADARANLLRELQASLQAKLEAAAAPRWSNSRNSTKPRTPF